MACRPPPPRNVVRALGERRHRHRRGIHGERARADAPHVHQVADERVHAVGLLLDDAQELAQLRPVRVARGAERRRRRALHRRKRRPKLVAHHRQERRARARELLKGRQVLDGHHHRLDPALGRRDGGGVDERAHAAPVGDREIELLGAQHLGVAQIVERRLAPVGVPAGQHLRHLRLGAALDVQPREDAPRLAVEGERRAGGRIEHHHADRAGLDQRLEVRPGAALGAVRAGVDDGRRLLREQH